jgi:solute carrier family 25 phosphate transporter 23/24/25/41
MVGAIAGRKTTPRNMADAFQIIFNEEGVRGFYRGIGVSSLKVMPSSGLSWMFYEKFKKVFHVDDDDDTSPH